MDLTDLDQFYVPTLPIVSCCKHRRHQLPISGPHCRLLSLDGCRCPDPICWCHSLRLAWALGVRSRYSFESGYMASHFCDNKKSQCFLKRTFGVAFSRQKSFIQPYASPSTNAFLAIPLCCPLCFHLMLRTTLCSFVQELWGVW